MAAPRFVFGAFGKVSPLARPKGCVARSGASGGDICGEMRGAGFQGSAIVVVTIEVCSSVL